jgi:hypothetical protein
MSNSTLPAWVPSRNLNETLVAQIQAVMYLLAIIPTIIVGLRCYVRIYVKKAFGMDDVTIVLATVRRKILLTIPTPWLSDAEYPRVSAC